MPMLNNKVLLLNQNYEPMTVIPAKKAIILICLQKVEIVEQHDLFIRSQFWSVPLPSVIRLRYYIRIPYRRVELTRRNIFKRDHNRCQYCGTTKATLTIDHVVPKTKGGRDTWENLVCACVKCNNKKGNRTPEQANMKLLNKLRRPNHLFFIQNFMGGREETWRPYIFIN